MSVVKVKQMAEAVCHALWEFEFRHLGDSDDGRFTWFTRRESDAAKVMRVTVERAELAPVVIVLVEFPNIATGRAIPVSIRMQLDCIGTLDQANAASTRCVQRVLELYKDMLEQTGPASRDAGLTRVLQRMVNQQLDDQLAEQVEIAGGNPDSDGS